MRYRRVDTVGDIDFFIVNQAERRSDVVVRHIDDLHAAMKTVKNAHPFAILRMVVTRIERPASYIELKVDYDARDRRSR